MVLELEWLVSLGEVNADFGKLLGWVGETE